jgi:hypothetical protein
MRVRVIVITVLAAILSLLLTSGSAFAREAAGLSAEIKEQLADSTYVYISSTRKDGSFGKPAEIWFLWHDGAVYVGTRPESWRVRRIGWGRPRARIAVGKVDGPSFFATGAVVNEPAVHDVLFDTYAKKYPEGWPKYEQNFRKGFKDGSRVMVKYTPEGS